MKDDSTSCFHSCSGVVSDMTLKVNVGAPLLSVTDRKVQLFHTTMVVIVLLTSMGNDYEAC